MNPSGVVNDDLSSVAYGNGTFVAVGIDAGVTNNGPWGGAVLTSPDGAPGSEK